MVKNFTQIRMHGTAILLSTVTSENTPHPAYMVGDEIDVQDYDCVVTGRRWKSPDFLIVYIRLKDKTDHSLRQKVAVAMFAPLESEGYHPSASQMDEAQRVIDLVRGLS